MNWSDLLTNAVPAVISLLSHAKTLEAPTPPQPTPAAPVPLGAVPYPHDFVKVVQTFLAAALKRPELKADGWVGPKTMQAIADVEALAKQYGLVT